MIVHLRYHNVTKYKLSEGKKAIHEFMKCINTCVHYDPGEWILTIMKIGFDIILQDACIVNLTCEPLLSW